MEKRCCDALRKLARQAKNRLSRRDYIEGNGYKVYSGGLIADYKLVHLSNKEDEKFYEKVSEMLSENIDTMNPLGRLVDKTKLELMSNKERERYIINLADKYLKMKARFEKEHANIEFAG
jgi:hypothetical protein